MWATVVLLFLVGTNSVLDRLPLVEGFEVDKDRDGLPDGWFDLVGASLISSGFEGKRCLCLRSPKQGLPAHARRAFAVPSEARYLHLSFAFKGAGINQGRLLPGLPGASLALYNELGEAMADYFLPAPFGSVGWNTAEGRFPIPEGAAHAVLTVGLFGASGTAAFDAVSATLFDRRASENFLLNPEFSLGSDLPEGWETIGVRRALHEGRPVLLFDGPGVAAQAVPFFGLSPVKATLIVEAKPLSERVEAVCEVSFRDFLGLPVGKGARERLPGNGKRAELTAEVPEDACGAMVRISVKRGKVALEEARLELLDDSGRPLLKPAEFTPPPSERAEFKGVAKGSALEASHLLDPPAGKYGRLKAVGGGRLSFDEGKDARFFGVALPPPSIVPDEEEAEEMAEMLSRMGLNLVKISLPFSPEEPFRCLLDPFSPQPSLSEYQLSRLDRLVAELAKRGIYTAIELWGPSLLGEAFDPNLQPLAGLLPFFSSEVRKHQKETVKALLKRENTHRGKTYADDPAVAYLTLTYGPTPFALLAGLRLPEPLESQIDKEFNKWLLRRYKSRAELARTWSHLGVTELKADEDPFRGTVRRARGYEAIEIITVEPTHRLRDTVRFYAEVERKYFKEMASFIRGLGYKGLLSACSDPSTFLADLRECSVLDLIEARAVLRPTGLWSPVSATGFGDPMGTALSLALSRRVSGKPYAVAWMEGGATHSNPVEPAHLWLLTMLCAERGVDILLREFAHLPGEISVPTLNAVNSLPHLASQIPLAAKAFRTMWRDEPSKVVKAGEEDLTAGGSPLMFLDPVEVVSGNFSFSFVPEGKGDLPKGRPPMPFLLARSSNTTVEVSRGRVFGQSEGVQFVGGLLGEPELDLGLARLNSNLWLGKAVLISLDGRPLPESRRLLFSCIGRLFLNEGARYADPFGLLVAHPGDTQRPPILESVKFSLLLKREGPAEAYALSLDGSKRAKVEVKKEEGGIIIEAGSPLVEIVFQPPS